MNNWVEVDSVATQKQIQYISQLMQGMFQHNRKFMLKEYFGKKSTKDFTFKEANMVIEMLLNQQEPIIEFYEQNRPREDVPF